MNRIFFFLLISIGFVFSSLKAVDDTLEIALSTETLALPFAIVHTQELTPEAKSLVSVLQNDLRLSGWFQLVRVDLDLNKLNIDHPFADPKLRSSSQTRYLLILKQNEKELSTYLFDLQKKASLKLKSLADNNWLFDSRKAAHSLCNEIVKALTGHPGIAHCKVLYAVTNSRSQPGGSEIWMCDYDGYGSRRVFQSSALMVSPSFIPGRGLSEFSYVSYKLGQPKMMWAKIGAGSSRISALGGSQLTPCFDSKGLQLAFVSDCAGNPDIYLMKLDQATGQAKPAQKLFASPKGTQASPTFSPDGTQIALVSSKDGSPRVYIIRIEDFLKGENNTKAKLISRKNRENTCPAWSPDGRFIAYSARTQGARQIWIYDCQTQTETCLTQGDGMKENPCWAGDSLHLYYDKEDASGSHLYLIDINLQKPYQLNSSGRIQRFPSCSR